MTFRFCDDLGPDGFGWMVEEAATRTSHAQASESPAPAGLSCQELRTMMLASASNVQPRP